MFLEEDVTKNAEFATDGLFNLGPIPGSKYKICGEQVESDNLETPMRPRFAFRAPVTAGWSQTRPWANENQPGPSDALLRKKPKYDSCLKRTIPFVSLATDSSGRNICVDSIVTNVYIRIPDDNVSTQSILSEVSSKICEESDLVLLDSKFVPITDEAEKGYIACPCRVYFVIMINSCICRYRLLEDA